MTQIIDKIKFRLDKLLKKKMVIPDMVEKRKVIDNFIEVFQPRYFIETGTFLGDTVEYFKNKFDVIYSIELSEELANKAKVRFANDINVTIVHGDSSIKLKDMIVDLKEPILFWLDGHYSSEFFIKDEYIKTAKGDTNTPIQLELDIILNSSVLPIILIDDARLFTGKNDYPTLNAIKQQVNLSGKNLDVFVNKDIIHIIPQKR
jgi:hypothetical protein